MMSISKVEKRPQQSTSYGKNVIYDLYRRDHYAILKDTEQHKNR